MAFYKKLYIKYRPQSLSDVFGQKAVITQLRGMFKSQRLSNVYLLSGATGCGKTTIGRIIYRYVNCLQFNREKVEPCGVCKSCASNYNMDLTEVDGATKRGINDSRELQNLAYNCPQYNYRVILIDEAHMLTKEAWNSLLKLLEDVPDETMIILCTTHPEKLPPAIIGRCTHLHIGIVDTDEVIGLLQYISCQEALDENIYTFELLKEIAIFSRGHLRNAIQTLDDTRNYIDGKINNQSINITTLLQDVTENILRAPEWQLVSKYLFAVYRGRYTGALRVVESVTNYETFINILMEYHTQTIYRLLSPKLMSNTYNWYYTELDKYQIRNDQLFLNLLTNMSKELVKTAFDIRSYLVNARDIMIAVTITLSMSFIDTNNTIP